jgi:DUF4097 and DUF4098 domain-containing protein YvlB
VATLPPPYSQRDAAQAQRYYQRSLRRPSMLGPLVLIVVGVIALLVETNKLNPVRLWDWYIRWWPLLLIGVGLLSLSEWWLDRRHAGAGYRWRRRSHAGLIALIVCLAVLAYMASATTHGLHGMHVFGHGKEDLFSHLLGQEHNDDRSLNRQIPARAPIDIQVPHGDVTVTPSGDDQIHVQAHLVVYAANDRAARRNLDALAPQLMVDGGNVTLRAADVSDGHADLTIEIPNGAVPSVTAGHGDVTLEGLAGPANVNADRGDVKADNITGEVHVRMGKGDFSAHAITGDLSLQGRLDDVSISDVQGKVGLEGDFFGDTNLAHIASAVHFHSSRTNVEAIMIPGDLSIDSGDLQLNNATGPVRISTSAKDVECSGITGDLRVEDGDGDISLGVVAPLGQLDIHNRNGAINLTVPRDASFQLQATARNGNIESKVELPLTSAGESQSISGQVGKGGPRIALVSDHGDIAITAMDVVPEPPPPPTAPSPPGSPAPPAPPAPPGPGGKSLRHLRPPKDANSSAQPIVQ